MTQNQNCKRIQASSSRVPPNAFFSVHHLSLYIYPCHPSTKETLNEITPPPPPKAMENRKLAISFLLLPTLLSLFHPLAALEPSKNISAVFAFGDSTLDAGNNNDLLTLVRADHAPYGRDFPGQVPTGRFTNGMLITDFLMSSLGLKDVLPAYSDLNLSVADLATGVSFASGGSGLDDLTATTVGVITIGEQVANFAAYIRRLQVAVGNEDGGRIIKGCNARYQCWI